MSDKNDIEKLKKDLENYINQEVTSRLDEFTREILEGIYTLYSNQLAFATKEQKKELLIQKGKITDFKVQRTTEAMQNAINRAYKLSSNLEIENSVNIGEIGAMSAEELEEVNRQIEESNNTHFEDDNDKEDEKETSSKCCSQSSSSTSGGKNKKYPVHKDENSEPIYTVDDDDRLRPWGEETDEDKLIDEMYGGDDMEYFGNSDNIG